VSQVRSRVARLFLVQTYQNGKSIPNGHKLYQTAIYYTKWSEMIPNCRKIYQYFPFQGPPNPNTRIFGLKTNNLATLVRRCLYMYTFITFFMWGGMPLFPTTYIYIHHMIHKRCLYVCTLGRCGFWDYQPKHWFKNIRAMYISTYLKRRTGGPTSPLVDKVHPWGPL
jgi:hypothetical protein